MAKADEVDFRIAVGDPNGPRSNVWRGFSINDEVYLCLRSMGGIEKISLHSSTICRRAFTDVEGPADGESDRVIDRWKRSATPDRGGGISYALVVNFPTDYLSTALAPESKKMIWVPAARSGGATALEFLFTKDDEPDARQFAEAANRSVISYTRLQNGEAFFLTWHHMDIWKGEDFTAPGLLSEDREYVISSKDPALTGRPARLLMYLAPTAERSVMTINEYGAYSVPLGTEFAEPMGKLSRTRLLKRKHGS